MKRYFGLESKSLGGCCTLALATWPWHW